MSNTDKSVEEIASQFCTKDHYSVMEGGVGFDGCDQCIRIAQALTTERQACEEWKKKALDSQEEIDDIKELLQRPSLYPETTGVSLIDDVRDLMQELRKEKKKVEEAESELKRVIGLDNDLLRERKEEIHSLTNKLSEAERENRNLKEEVIRLAMPEPHLEPHRVQTLFGKPFSYWIELESKLQELQAQNEIMAEALKEIGRLLISGDDELKDMRWHIILLTKIQLVQMKALSSEAIQSHLKLNEAKERVLKASNRFFYEWTVLTYKELESALKALSDLEKL